MTADLLDAEVRKELAGLPRNLADKVAGHLAAAEMLMPEDPAEGYRHARHARNLASRVGAVREACGLAAYHVGEWAEALAELRTARRVLGNDAYLPVMADCERGLGRPERALDMARSPEVAKLDQAGQVEMRIVASGARRDLGQYDAAVVGLQGPELESRQRHPWSARLYYAYAEALVGAGRADEAVTWFARAEAADEAGETDAEERLAELQGVDLADPDENIIWGDAEESDPETTHLWTDATPDADADAATADAATATATADATLDGTTATPDADAVDAIPNGGAATPDDASAPAGPADQDAPEEPNVPKDRDTLTEPDTSEEPDPSEEREAPVETVELFGSETGDVPEEPEESVEADDAREFDRVQDSEREPEQAPRPEQEPGSEQDPGVEQDPRKEQDPREAQEPGAE